jgi:hypothetical protein
MPKHPRPRWWIHEYPWARRLPGDQVFYGTHSAYPSELWYRHILLDDEAFTRFMELFWSIKLQVADLNLLEYFGLLIPVRKAVVHDIQPLSIQYRTRKGPVTERTSVKWRHVLGRYREQHKRRGEEGEAFPQPMDLSFGQRHTNLDILIAEARPTPWLFVERIAHLDKAEHGLGYVHPPRQRPEWITTGCLTTKGRLLRPSQIGYWRLLGNTNPPIAHVLEPEFKLGRAAKRPRLSPATADALPFHLSPDDAMKGNSGVRRFYLVGSGARRVGRGRLSSGTVGFGFGQDTHLVQLMHRLHRRVELPQLLAIAAAGQRRGGPKDRAFAQLAWRSKRLGGHEGLAVPELRQNFYRDLLIRVRYQALLCRGTPSEVVIDQLRRETGLRFEYVRRLIPATARLLAAT